MVTNPLPKLIRGLKFADGIEVVAQPAAPQATPADPSGCHQEVSCHHQLRFAATSNRLNQM
jgi:hypothetical protein